jgi:hypothetical protein
MTIAQSKPPKASQETDTEKQPGSADVFGKIIVAWAAFASGLLRPSLLSAVIALVSCAAAVIAADIFITEDSMAGPDSAFYAQDTLDDYAFATSDALRFLSHPPQGDHVALIGTAAMREALGTDEDIAARIERGYGKAIPVVDFMNGGQSGIEMAALADSLGHDFQGVVVLGISFSRLAADSSELRTLVREPRLAFVSPAADVEIRAAGFKVPHRIGNYLIDNYKFFVARYRSILWHLISGTRPHHDSRTYLGRPPADAKQWASDSAILKARLAHYDERADNNLGSMDRVIRLFPDRRKVRIVLLEIPLNPRAADDLVGHSFVDAHRARMQAFAEREGVVYWDLNQVAGLTPDDFQDWAHINSASAQDRWTSALIDRLLPLIQTK